MAAMTKIAAKFTADTEHLEKGLKDVMRQLSKMQSVSAKAGRSLQRIGNLQAFQVYTQIAGWVGTAATAIKSFGSDTATAIDNTAKAARNLGLSYGQFAGLGMAANEAGLQTEQLFDVFKDMNKNTAEAAAGAGGAGDAFRELGLDANALLAMNPAERFETIVGALGQIENAAARSAVAMRIFGEQGVRLGSLYSAGAAGIAEAVNMAQRLGLLLTDQQANNVEGMNDSLARVSASFTGIINQITANLAPAVKGIADAWTAFAANLGGAKIGEYISDALWDALEYAASWVDTVGGFFEGLFALGGDGATAWENAGSTWQVVWDMGGRIYDLFDSLWSTMMSGLNFMLSKLAQLLKNITALVNKIPGINLDSVERGLQNMENYFAEGSESWGERAADKFNSAISTTRDIDGQDTAGSAQQTVRSWRDAARAARNAADANTAAAGSMTDAAASAARGLAGGLDSRSTAGVNYMLAQMRGGSTVEKQQLSTQKQIAQNTARRPFTLVTASI
jgi:hypothetical protein